MGDSGYFFPTAPNAARCTVFMYSTAVTMLAPRSSNHIVSCVPLQVNVAATNIYLLHHGERVANCARSSPPAPGYSHNVLHQRSHTHGPLLHMKSAHNLTAKGSDEAKLPYNIAIRGVCTTIEPCGGNLNTTVPNCRHRHCCSPRADD
jgi:hypothetical protein